MNKIVDTAKAVVANPAVRKAFVGLVIAVLAALGVVAASGCGSERPAIQVPAPVVCAVRALSQHVTEDDATQIVHEAAAGRTDTADRLLSGLSVEQSIALARDLRACTRLPIEAPDAG